MNVARLDSRLKSIAERLVNRIFSLPFESALSKGTEETSFLFTTSVGIVASLGIAVGTLEISPSITELSLLLLLVGSLIVLLCLIIEDSSCASGLGCSSFRCKVGRGGVASVMMTEVAEKAPSRLCSELECPWELIPSESSPWSCGCCGSAKTSDVLYCICIENRGYKKIAQDQSFSWYTRIRNRKREEDRKFIVKNVKHGETYVGGVTPGEGTEVIC